jgi:membrane dipeptidase
LDANKIHRESIVFNAHDHRMIEIAYLRNIGKEQVFRNYIAPGLHQGGVNVLSLVVSGDNGNFIEMSDLMVWGTLRSIEMLLEEEEESKDLFEIVKTSSDLERIPDEGKLAIILAFEGGRPLEGRPYLDTLDTLRIYYRLGLRHFQIVDQGRNRLGDGHQCIRTNSRLTPFGVKVIKECERLGIVIDTAHLGDHAFYDLLDQISTSIIDSHSNAREVNNHARNLSDERMKAMAAQGGVVGISLFDALVNKEKVAAGIQPAIEDVMKHLDHMCEILGPQHVGLGPDFCEFPHIMNHGFCPAPGYFEGSFVGVRESYGTQGLSDITMLPALTGAMINRGYSEQDIKSILGGNFMRVFRQSLKSEVVPIA